MTVRITAKRAVAALLGLVALVFAASFSGLIPIAASSEHWPVTRWFLHWTMQNSVRTQSLFGAPGDPADASGLVSAAGHFEAVCADCHGAPGRPRSPVMQAATPHAPYLPATVGDYSDRELHWIIDHGIKYTGMPAWPARGRTDEIAHMTAFVRRLGDMSATDYHHLTQGGGATPLSGCATCHGADGMGHDQSVPVLAGQSEAYLVRALTAYRAGTRQSAVMGQAAHGLSDADIVRAASAYAAMPGLRSADRSATDSESRAARIARFGLPEKQLPACLSCHAEDRLKDRPRLAGQKAAYIAERLRRWQGDKHVTDARKSEDTMPTIARRIPEEDIDAIARWWEMRGD